MPYPGHDPTFIPGEDAPDAGLLRKIHELQQILDVVDTYGVEEPEGRPQPEEPPEPKSRFGKFMRKHASTIDLAASALGDIGEGVSGNSDVRSGRVYSPRSSSLAGFAQRQKAESLKQEKLAELDREERNTFRRERMLNRRSVLPTILASVLKDPAEAKAARQPNAIALVEYIKEQDWFKGYPPAIQQKIIEKALKVGEDDDESDPRKKAYEAAMGRMEAEDAMGVLKPPIDADTNPDEWQQKYFTNLISRVPGVLEDRITPVEAKAEAIKARTEYFGPPGSPPGAARGAAPMGAPGGPGANAGAPGGAPQQPGMNTALMDPAAQQMTDMFPDVGQLPGVLGGMNLPPFRMNMLNYSPAPEAPAPPAPMAGGPPALSASPQMPAGPPAPPMGGGPQAPQVPLTSQSLEAMRPAFIAYDQLKARYATMPDGAARLARARAAFIAQYRVSPE